MKNWSPWCFTHLDVLDLRLPVCGSYFRYDWERFEVTGQTESTASSSDLKETNQIDLYFLFSEPFGQRGAKRWTEDVSPFVTWLSYTGHTHKVPQNQTARLRPGCWTCNTQKTLLREKWSVRVTKAGNKVTPLTWRPPAGWWPHQISLHCKTTPCMRTHSTERQRSELLRNLFFSFEYSIVSIVTAPLKGWLMLM